MLVPTPPQTVVGRPGDAGTVWLGETATSVGRADLGGHRGRAAGQKRAGASERNKGAPLAVGLSGARRVPADLDDFVMGKLNRSRRRPRR